ncbi:hypothetical protein Btru_017338 [Bulinus truncatus]|nr:hypothetical protein Btru_017338 [Bulinus truncatus]
MRIAQTCIVCILYAEVYLSCGICVAAKVHDPMYNFDTHFPERLSRLHLHGDFNASGSFRKKKNRSQRSGARYKTQPVTFDEIKEVDEEPVTPASPEQSGPSNEQLKGQLQAFSRSMDGLLPKSVAGDQSPQHQFSRSGSRKFQRHPECIPEKAEIEPVTPQPVSDPQQCRLVVMSPPSTTSAAAIPTTPTLPSSSSTPPETQTSPRSPASLKPGGEQGEDAGISPITSPNVASRRQKITAKAKKRQKALEDSDI